MNDDKKPGYREGDDDTQLVNQVELSQENIPITSFFLMLTQDGEVEIVTDLPGIPMQRVATWKDIHHISTRVMQNAQIELTAKAASAYFANSISSVIHARQAKNIEIQKQELIKTMAKKGKV